MLSEQQWEQVEQFVNSEYMTQVEDAGFEAVLDGVTLALSVVNQNISIEELIQRALSYLHRYGHSDGLPLRPEVKHALAVMKYGSEQEATAQERFHALNVLLTDSNQDHVRLWYQDEQKTWHILEAYNWSQRTFYYEQGTNPTDMMIVGSPGYLYHRDLDELIQLVRKQFNVQIYDIPIEQWTFHPMRKKDRGE